MTKKEYVEQYVAALDTALKALFDESREQEILDADKAALGDDYLGFEDAISAAYDKVEQARHDLQAFADKL